MDGRAIKVVTVTSSFFRVIVTIMLHAAVHTLMNSHVENLTNEEYSAVGKHRRI